MKNILTRNRHLTQTRWLYCHYIDGDCHSPSHYCNGHLHFDPGLVLPSRLNS